MNRKRTQTYICAISPKGAKHYLAVGETKLRVEETLAALAKNYAEDYR